MLAEKMMANCVDDDEFPDLEKATIWYRCTICSGYVFSIPELKRHWIDVHKKPLDKLPANLPPGAEDGLVYYDYKLSFNKAPSSPYPYIKLSSSYKPADNSSTSSEDEESVNERPVAAVQRRTQREEDAPSLPATPVTSPPDSGIQMHDAGSEAPEEEGQQLQPVSRARGNFQPKSFNEISYTDLPSTSAAAPVNEPNNSGKLDCPHCEKVFSNISSRNFHVKKFHKPCENNEERRENNPAAPPEKIVLAIHRDTTTGDLVSSNTSNKRKKPRAESTGSFAHIVRKSSSSSEKVNAPTVASPSKKFKAMEENLSKQSECDPASFSASDPVIKRKPGPKSRTRPNETVDNSAAADQNQSKKNVDSTSDSECEGSRTTRASVQKTPKTNAKVLPSSSSSSSAQESENEALESESSDFDVVLPPPKKKRVKRAVKDKSPEQNRRGLRRRTKKEAVVKSDDDNSDSSDDLPVARQTRSKALKFPLPSSSGSESEPFIVSDDDEIESNDDDEGELSERSTTPEDLIGAPSPNDKKSKSKKTMGKSKSKRKPVSVSEDESDAEEQDESDAEEQDESDASSGKTLFSLVTKPSSKKDKTESRQTTSKARNCKKSTETSSVPPNKVKVTNKQAVKPTPPVQQMINCKRCNKQFRGAAAFILHLYSKHKAEKAGFTCGKCDTLFTTATELEVFNEHMRACKGKKTEN